jgi:hypothetical protein
MSIEGSAASLANSVYAAFSLSIERSGPMRGIILCNSMTAFGIVSAGFQRYHHGPQMQGMHDSTCGTHASLPVGILLFSLP